MKELHSNYIIYVCMYIYICVCVCVCECVKVVEVKTVNLVDIPVTCDKTAAVSSHRFNCLGYRKNSEEKEIKQRHKTHYIIEICSLLQRLGYLRAFCTVVTPVFKSVTMNSRNNCNLRSECRFVVTLRAL
jgi:hypothetical protein